MREIAATPAMLAECRAVLAALREDAARPAGPEGVRRVIGRRRALFPVGSRPPEEAAAWWEDYYAALADLPESALEAGMAAHIRDPRAEFMPKPGRLRALAMSSENRAARAYERARAAVGLPAPSEGRTRVGREAVAALMADYRARAPRAPEQPQPGFAPGRADAGGLTAAMRQALGARAGE